MNKSLANKLFTHSVKLRGIILEATVEVERKMDRFLANYFCKDELLANELLEMILMNERSTLAGKKDVLFFILNKPKYEHFLSDNPTFKTDFENLIPHRNIFAHLEIDRDFSDYDGVYQIKFKRFSKGKLEIKKYGREDVKKITKDFERLNNALDVLLK